jgi:hypothetical protein
MIVLAGCASREADGSTAATPATTATTSEATTTPLPTEPTRQDQSCPELTEKKIIRSDTGSLLRATIVSQLGPRGAQDVAIPADLEGEFPELRTGVVDDLNGTFERALASGGFIYGAPRITIALENTSSDPATIYDVRPVNLRTVCMPTGPLARFETQGGDAIEFVINLDADRPVALVPVGENEVPFQPYFPDNPTTVAPNDTQPINLNFILAKYAREFDVAVSYISEGTKYTQVVHPAGGPFRATPLVCPEPQDRSGLSSDDVQRLAEHRFSKVVVPDDPTSVGFAIKEVDPKAFSEDCVTR